MLVLLLLLLLFVFSKLEIAPLRASAPLSGHALGGAGTDGHIALRKKWLRVARSTPLCPSPYLRGRVFLPFLSVRACTDCFLSLDIFLPVVFCQDPPLWLVYHELAFTTKEYMRSVRPESCRLLSAVLNTQYVF